MTIEALKQALEALEQGYKTNKQASKNAITALRAAIEQAEKQEPRHIVQSNGRHSPLLTHMMNSRNTPPAAQPCPYIRSTAEGTHHCALANQTRGQA
jgi:hypothetical protein